METPFNPNDSDHREEIAETILARLIEGRRSAIEYRSRVFAFDGNALPRTPDYWVGVEHGSGVIHVSFWSNETNSLDAFSVSFSLEAIR